MSPLAIQPELVQAIAAFVPDHVVNGIINGQSPKPGDVLTSEGAILFADVAGFTPMSERLARIMRGLAPREEARGAEELNRIINQTFSAMMMPIQQHGGVVTHFSGDALTAYFERPPDFTPSDVTASAVTCAYAMHQAISPYAEVRVVDEIFPVSVKIGIGYGPVVFLTVGDERCDMKSIVGGYALDEATAAESHATRDQIVLAPSAWFLLPDTHMPPSASWVKYPGDSSDVAAFHVMPPVEPDTRHIPPSSTKPVMGLDKSQQEHLLHALSPYLPQSIYDRLLLARGDLPGDYRRVTNLFVLFDGLDFDAPDLGEKAQAYYCWAYGVVDRYGGRLIRMMADDKGNGLHILFGAPDKHVDDPARGLRCALALQHDPDRPSFITQQHIGVASGNVFAATIGSPTRREYTVIGDEINLSSRLTSACPPGDIWVDAYTRDRTVQQFAFETLPPMRLKGKSEPVIADRLLDERPVETGLVARFLASRWRIVGRDAEVSALLHAANRAIAGSGEVIAIEGQAGVGKTRLMEEVVRHWVDRGGDGFVGQTVSHGLNSPYHLWASFWHAFFGFSEADSVERRWQKVETIATNEAPDVTSWIGVLAPVLGLPDSSLPLVALNTNLSSLDAADRRRKLFDVTLSLLVARAQHRPLLVLFEDLHWADRPSLELIDYIGEQVQQAPLLVCLCFRPRDDVEMNVLSSMHCTWRILDELQPEQSAELVRAILGEVNLPPVLEQEIYDKTQGNPLFVEEILNSLIASGTLVTDDGHYRLSDDPHAVAIPDTLQDLLMSRIDRLEAPSRDLVQVASAIDRRFPYAILRGIYPYPMPDLEMQDRLNELIRPEDLARLDRPEPDPVYLFKHALTRDVAYASLPFARRHTLHRLVGEFIESRYADHLEEHYSTLAYHFEQGEQPERAIIYAVAAGIQAQEIYANDEALRYFKQAEGCLVHLPLDTYWPYALQMHLKRSLLHRLNGDYNLAEADLNLALELAQRYHDTRAEAEAYCLLADLRHYEMRNEESLRYAMQAHTIALAHNHTEELNASLVQLGIAYDIGGDIERSMDYLQQATDLAEERGDRLMSARALNTMAVIWWLRQGELDKALVGFQRVLEIRREAGAKDREAECLANITNVQFRKGNFEAALKASQEALSVGRAAGWQYGLSYVQLDQAEIHCYVGDYESGQRLIEKAKDNLVSGDDMGIAYVQLSLGRNIHLDLGHVDQALSMLEASLQFMKAHDHYEEMIRALTALGVGHFRQGRLSRARTYLNEAYELSLTQHFPWQRAETCCQLGLVALTEDRLDEAAEWAQRAHKAAGQGSGSDWMGTTYLLLARTAQRRGAPTSQVTFLYEQAVSLTEPHCRAIERAWVLREAGRYLVAHATGKALAHAQSLVSHAEDWLATRGIS